MGAPPRQGIDPLADWPTRGPLPMVLMAPGTRHVTGTAQRPNLGTSPRRDFDCMDNRSLLLLQACLHVYFYIYSCYLST
jgi:hypothetical protein